MGFLRNQEVNMARKMIIWQHVRNNIPLPDKETLDQKADEVVSEAERIAKETGKNIFSILKELAQKVRK